MILMGTAQQAGLAAGKEAKEKGYNEVSWMKQQTPNDLIAAAMQAAYEWFYTQEPQDVGALLFLYRYFAEGYLAAFKAA
jgi:hypothetical protein